jgi:hypothetical protein
MRSLYLTLTVFCFVAMLYVESRLDLNSVSVCSNTRSTSLLPVFVFFKAKICHSSEETLKSGSAELLT